MNKDREKWLIQSSWKANMFLYWIVTYRKKNRAVCFISTAGGHKFPHSLTHAIPVIVACELPNLLLLYFTLSVSSTASMGPILTLFTHEGPATSCLLMHWIFAHYELISAIDI